MAIEYRWADNQIDRLPALAAELVRRQVAVIATTGGGAPALAAKAATTTIPIVFNVIRRPGQAWSCRQPRAAWRQCDRVNFFSGEVAAKRLELLRELVPGTARVAVLVNPSNASNTETTLRDMEVAGRAIGLQIQVFNASTNREIDAAFATFMRERPDALFRRHRSLFQQQACPNCPTGGASHDPRDIFGASHCRSRRADELRKQPYGCLSSGRRLCRPHPQGREAGRTAGAAADQVRAGHQPHRPPGCSASPCRQSLLVAPTR